MTANTSQETPNTKLQCKLAGSHLSYTVPKFAHSKHEKAFDLSCSPQSLPFSCHPQALETQEIRTSSITLPSVIFRESTNLPQVASPPRMFELEFSGFGEEVLSYTPASYQNSSSEGLTFLRPSGTPCPRCRGTRDCRRRSSPLVFSNRGTRVETWYARRRKIKTVKIKTTDIKVTCKVQSCSMLQFAHDGRQNKTPCCFLPAPYTTHYIPTRQDVGNLES